MTWQPTKPGKEITVFSDADLKRFHSRYTRGGESECWNWNWHAGHAGHGRMWAAGRHTLASHIALHLAGKPRPEGAAALHSCDNPACVNPDHLRWGTQLDNIQDRVTRHRSGAAFGAANGSTKLTVAQVRQIRADPRGSKDIAAAYGVTAPAVNAIKKRKTWRWVDDLDAKQGGETVMPGVQPQAKEQAGALPIGEQEQPKRRVGVELLQLRILRSNRP